MPDSSITGALAPVAAQVRRDLALTIVGQTRALDLMLTAVLCNGHALIEGVPGLGKTLAVRVPSRGSCGCGFSACNARRI